MQQSLKGTEKLAGMPNLRPEGHMQIRMAVKVTQHNIINLFKTLREFLVNTCCNVFSVQLKTTILPVWLRDAKSLDTPARGPRVALLTGSVYL